MDNNCEVVFGEENGLRFMQFKRLLELGVKHCYTLMGENIDFTTGSPFYEESLEKVCKVIDIEKDKLFVTRQTHTDTVKCITSKTSKDELAETDGLITDDNTVAIATKNADCILLFFYDPVKKVIANVHLGWKGTFKKIAEKTVVKMITNYGCNPKDILCFINPSIRKCHFEVDSDVKDLCEEIFKFTNRQNEFIKKGEIKEEKQKYYIDTVLINRILLEDVGLLPENIIDCNICSMCNSNEIASARAQGKIFKRAMAVIKL
jgi:YfiH family protein